MLRGILTPTSQEQADALITAITRKDYLSLEQIAKNYDVNAQNEKGMTALLEAARLGDVKAIEILLNNKADPNICGSTYSSMEYAVIAKCEEGLKLLLKHGGKHKDSALAQAVHVDSTICAKLLLEAGANPNVKFYDETDQPTVLIFAAKRGYKQILQLLIQHKANIEAQAGVYGRFDSNALMAAALAGKLDCLTLLIEAGANLDAQNYFGQSAAMFAVYGRQPDCLKLLLEKGADPNLQTFEIKHDRSGGESALHIAAKKGQEKCIEILIKYNAAVNLKDGYGKKPMYYAVTESESKTHGYPENPDKSHYLTCASLFFKRRGGDMSDSPEKYRLRTADKEFHQYIKNIW